MKLLYSTLLSCTIFFLQIWQIQGECEHLDAYQGEISYQVPHGRYEYFSKCWQIDPPQESIIYLKFLELNIDDDNCFMYLELSNYNDGKRRICQRVPSSDWRNRTIFTTGSINVTLFIELAYGSPSFSLKYDSESQICDIKNAFRCSSHQCVHPEQVCDGVKDCENGLDENECDSKICDSNNAFRCSSYQCVRSEQVCDGVKDCENGLDENECGITLTKESNLTRVECINWLKNHQTSFGWGRNTHRAVTSLYLTEAAKFQGKNSDEEDVMIRQLQLKTAASLLRNLTEPMTVNELSMYVNALLVTCHNVRNIFTEDLLEILANRAFSNLPASPGAYLTLCNANWPFSNENVQQLLTLLSKHIDYPFALEIKAMTIMALSCLKQKYLIIDNMHNASFLYNKSIEHLMASQREDGGFGNAHTTAMVMQALISSGLDNSDMWDIEDATKYLLKNLNSSIEFLSVYLSLPLLKGHTLVDIGSVDCSNYKRKLEEDEDISDVMDKLSVKINVQYSLYIGDNKNIIHDIYLKAPENSTVYDVMKVAQIVDPKYKFSLHKSDGHMYIYEVAGLTNDMEAGKFWLFYITPGNTTQLEHFTQSPDQVTLHNKDHLVMWYKSANI